MAVLSVLILGACAEDDAPDFCKNHAQFHAEHADASAQLRITMTEDGRIESELQLSDSGSQRPTASLREVHNVYTLESASQCQPAQSGTDTGQGTPRFTYSSDCGADNKLGQVNVVLFNTLPDLEEVVVDVKTPATKKHFAIHRQCESAIFRLQ